MSKETQTKVNTIQCLSCNDIIYSRARHDYRSCSCRKVSVDGGFDYFKVVAPRVEDYATGRITVNAGSRELYDDWNYSEDRWGLIKGKNDR